MKMRESLLLFLFACAACPSRRQEPRTGGDLKAVSAITTQQLAAMHWPPSVPPVERPQSFLAGDGKRSLRSFALDPSCAGPLAQAEKAFNAKDCGAAEPLYRKALEASPSCYPANIGLGDCAFRQRRGSDAIEEYRRAEQTNPDDYQPWLFEADLLMRSGNRAEARDRFVQTLSLAPYQRSALIMLQYAAPLFHAELHAEPLQPRVFFRPSADGKSGDVLIAGDLLEGAPQWMSYALCRAFGPGGRRGQAAVPAPGRWSLQAERACIEQLAGAYRKELAGEKPPRREAALDRLLAAQDANAVGAYILYEIAARMDPQIMLKVSDDSRRQVRDYVEHFVLPDKPQ